MKTVNDFGQEKQSLWNISALTNYNMDVRAKRLINMSVTQYAIHFRELGPTNEQLSSRMDYASTGYTRNK